MEIEILSRGDGGTEFYAQPSRLHLGAQNAAGVDTLHFLLPEAWAGLAVSLHIEHSDGSLAAPVLLGTDRTATVDTRFTGWPSGRWMLAAVGEDYTACSRPGIYDVYGTLSLDDAAEPPSPTLYEQFISQVLASAEEAAAAARSAASSESTAAASTAICETASTRSAANSAAAASAAERAEAAALRAESVAPEGGSVISVNGKGGSVMLTAADVGALPCPASLTAGRLLRVQSVDESTHTVTLEDVAPADLVQPPTSTAAGLVRVNAQYGITVREDDLLSTAPATQGQLDAMTDSYAPVPPAHLPYGVKKALAVHADAADWTEDEKAAARGALGAAAESEVMHTSAYDENGDGMVDTAEKTAASLILRMNGGVTEGIDQFTFNGSSAKVVDITPAAIGSGGLRMTKAWENTSATSNFAPQSIILPALADGSHYEAILVHYKPDRLFNSFDDSALIFPGTYTSVRNYVIGDTYKDVEIYTRQIAYNILSDGSMKVTVDNCVYYPSSSTSSYANNLIVPTAIYGVAGIS